MMITTVVMLMIMIIKQKPRVVQDTVLFLLLFFTMHYICSGTLLVRFLTGHKNLAIKLAVSNEGSCNNSEGEGRVPQYMQL